MELTDIDVLQLVRDWIREVRMGSAGQSASPDTFGWVVLEQRRLLWSDIGDTAVKLAFREGPAGLACYSLYIEVLPGAVLRPPRGFFRTPQQLPPYQGF